MVKYNRINAAPKKEFPTTLLILMCGLCTLCVVIISAITFQPKLLDSIKLIDHGLTHGKISLNLGETVVRDKCEVAEDHSKFDCLPRGEVNEDNCKRRHCCWKTSDNPRVPWCFFSNNYKTYDFVNYTKFDGGLIIYWKNSITSAYPRDVKLLKMLVEYETDNRLHVKITDAENTRYESPYPKVKSSNTTITKQKYKFIFDKSQTGFKITRENGDNIFNSLNKGSFIFSDQFIQLSALFSGKIYGLGEHTSKLQLDTNWNVFTMFNHDLIPQENKNLYGSHPFYLVLEQSGRSHGVFLRNSNAMDIVLQPSPAVTFRTIGGVLDFYFFLGPTPEEVVSQYTELIGYPFMPPYWSLGFHLSRYGYNNLTNMKETWRRNRNADIPFDTQWNDIDYMVRNNDFTLDMEHFGSLPDFVQQLHEADMHWIPMIDPGISGSEQTGTYPPYELGVTMDVFVKDWNGQTFKGKVWNSNSTVFPDFTHPNITKYWRFLLKKFHRVLPFDGVWIDMNEPSNFLDGTRDGCPDNELEHPVYTPSVDGGKLCYKTLCMSAVQHAGLHYNLHNLYGITESAVTNHVIRNITSKRPFIISRSTFPGHGHYAGHWSGDVVSNWSDMKKSIPQLLSFSLFGVPMMGADICGFNGNTTVSLCNRWHQLGAFYPFSRNHNTDDGIDQDPASLGEPVITSAKTALNIRYTLLPYLYTLFLLAHVRGTTVARPLFFEFPLDENTYDMDESFLWGPAILVVPVLQENATSVDTYLPRGRWYDWYSYTELTCDQGKNYTVPAPVDKIPVYVRGGFVIPMQVPGVTTAASRKNVLFLLAAHGLDANGVGELYWDDGQTLDTYETGDYLHVKFNLTTNSLTNMIEHNDMTGGDVMLPVIDLITVLGGDKVTQVTLDGQNHEFQFIEDKKILTVNKLNKRLNETFTLSWT